jgi:[protein-PII] uridylyltransferase
MNPDPQALRAPLVGRRAAIEADHRRGANGFATCTSLTAIVDDVLQQAFDTLPTELRAHMAVFALGGYGRAELCPKSDVDIMVLCPAGDMREPSAKAATTFLHLLWDAGLDVGHSVRTVQEVLVLRGQSHDAWASVIESRLICGSKALAQQLFDALSESITGDHNIWFIKGVFEDIARRHERFGNSVKLLEPNVKKSAGGLRDLQAIFWLFRATDPAWFYRLENGTSALQKFLSLLRSREVIDRDEYRAALAAVEFLLRTRHEMHFLRGAGHDTLEYALQLEVADGLGFRQPGSAGSKQGPSAELRSVEVFMRAYYLHARTLHGLHRRLSHRFKEIVEPPVFHDHGVERVGGRFFITEDLLSVDPSVTRFDEAADIFEAFSHAAEREADLDFRLRAVIERSADLIAEPERRSQPLAAFFQRILRSRRVAETLRAMNELNILGRYIPEFGDLVAFFQHNVYHYFTADEHTLIALANAERLREQQGILREVFRNLRRKDILYLAILLHDIAKPRGVADHEITGVAMAQEILQRLGMEDLFEDVAFLIRHHLVMEQVAFRRNIHDPDTIREFAGRFDRPEQLDYLYLLTYADLSAVNINLWTEWKSTMLQDLYRRTAEVLRRNLRGAQIDDFHQSKREAAEMKIVDKLSASMPREHIERHLQGMQSAAYVTLFSEEEIAEHIKKSSAEEPISTLFSHAEGYTEVTMIARDAPYALARFCAVLAANDANILDANVFTRDDGIIIDRFRVSDATNKLHLDPRVCAKIADDVTRVMAGELDIGHLFEAHRRRWKRRPKHPVNPDVRTDVEFEDNPRYTILDVFAPDSVGFLYRVTEVISRLGLDIYFAKIATRVDGIVDAFYVLDRAGQPIDDQSRREVIRGEILDTLRALADQQLEESSTSGTLS